jgi:hypothetical protein
MLLSVTSALLMMLAPQGYTPSKPPEVPLVRDYLALCAADLKVCSEVLFDHAWRHSVGDQRVGYCLPETGEDEVDVTNKVVAWLKSRPDLAGNPTDPSLNTALMNTYPCR